MLLYEASESKKLELRHEKWKKSGNAKTQIFYAPMDEFNLLNTKLEAGEEEVVDKGIDGPAVIVVTQGSVVLSRLDGSEEVKLQQGQVVFIKPGTRFKFKAGAKAEVWGSFVEG